MKILVSWIGIADLRAARKDQPALDPGPNLRLLQARRFDRVFLLNDLPVDEPGREAVSPRAYCEWLRALGHPVSAGEMFTAARPLRNNYADVFRFTIETVESVRRAHADGVFTFHLSPGYPAAHVAMILAAQTRFESPVELINTSVEAGVEPVELPFVVRLEDVLPALLRGVTKLEAANHGAFEGLIGSSELFRAAVRRAQHFAGFERLSVLIAGETGTGKELFARAIHRASPRSAEPFIAVNVAALHDQLIDSELFGHVRGAFTDAKIDRVGRIKSAEDGTLFLDEIGDLSAPAQVKFLRLLQERVYSPVGSDAEVKTDVRVVAATHVDLAARVRDGRFREDLYHRLLDGALLELPPLRRRGDDRREFVEHFLAEWNQEHGVNIGIADDALAVVARRPWYGNVRELRNAVRRLALETPLWRDPPVVDTGIVEAILGRPTTTRDAPFNDLDAREFASALAAMVDSLLDRYRAPGRLPASPGDDVFESVLHPLVRGRALRAANGNATQAGLLFRPSKLDLTDGKADRKYAEVYERHWKPSISSDRVNSWCFGEAG